MKNQTNCLRIARITATVVLFFCRAQFSSAQTTNISGIVNTYHQVLEIIPSKSCLRVTNIGMLDINSYVMIVQMKGASMITTNNAAFGDTTSLNNAGNYEIATICYIRAPDSVFLFHTLLNNYTYTTGKVQLVQFAEYYSANVTDTVKAQPWDSLSGTGGVIAIRVDQDLALNKPISAEALGNKGGAFFQHSGNCPVGLGYAYAPTNFSAGANGAYKGESVADIPANLEGGKGAPVNGGGGGNNHNNSGAGGANLTSGGNGGGNSSSGPFGCNIGGNHGRGGKPLSSHGGRKIFLGGGGGAGHSNNGLSNVAGGNGGGIIFLWANTITGNNELITANGGNGGNSISDGAGGGGAGGTIIMHVPFYTGNVTIQANGGNGGNSDNGGNAGRCFGGGGGGSGGEVYFTGATPPVTIATNGGTGGIESNRDAACNAAVPGVNGSNGQQIPAYTFLRSTNPAGYCALLLPSGLLYFKALRLEKKVQLSWEIAHPELADHFTIERKNRNNEWVIVKTLQAFDRIQNYTSTDENPVPGYNLYRLRITEKNNSIVYSPIRQVWFDFPKNGFIVYPNPARDKITVQGTFNNYPLLKLSTINGKIVLQQPLLNNITEISLPVLSPGTYLLQVNETTQKLIIH